MEFGSRLFSLSQKTQQHDEDIKQLRQDLKALNQRVDQLSEAMQRVTFELQRTHENAAHERELLRLQLENALLRFEKRLPPGNRRDEDSEA
jgi:chromosome segregation ATPase